MRCGFRIAPIALAATALLAAPLACAKESLPPSGRELFVRHCASCHGLSGTGDGPLASRLVKPPADLTALRQRNGGRFDHAAVMAVIDGRRDVVEHGPREMPVWGAIFEKRLEDEPYGSYTTLLHARALADYVESIQR